MLHETQHRLLEEVCGTLQLRLANVRCRGCSLVLAPLLDGTGARAGLEKYPGLVEAV